jgi:hypothetical protein
MDRLTRGAVALYRGAWIKFGCHCVPHVVLGPTRGKIYRSSMKKSPAGANARGWPGICAQESDCSPQSSSPAPRRSTWRPGCRSQKLNDQSHAMPSPDEPKTGRNVPGKRAAEGRSSLTEPSRESTQADSQRDSPPLFRKPGIIHGSLSSPRCRRLRAVIDELQGLDPLSWRGNGCANASFPKRRA